MGKVVDITGVYSLTKQEIFLRNFWKQLKLANTQQECAQLLEWIIVNKNPHFHTMGLLYQVYLKNRKAFLEYMYLQPNVSEREYIEMVYYIFESNSISQEEIDRWAEVFQYNPNFNNVISKN